MNHARWCLAFAATLILSTGCGSVAQQPHPDLGGSDIGESAATRIAEQLAVEDSHGDPVLTRPSDARSMPFEQAERTLGSGEDYSLGTSARVWLVHVYGDVAGKRGGPPPPPGTPATPPTTASTTPPNYFVIIDALTGRVVVENY